MLDFAPTATLFYRTRGEKSGFVMIDEILFVQETNYGSDIYLKNGNTIVSTTDPDTLRERIERAVLARKAT